MINCGNGGDAHEGTVATLCLFWVKNCCVHRMTPEPAFRTSRFNAASIKAWPST